MKSTAAAFVLGFLFLPASLFARCPIPANGTLVVDAPAGNLIIDTSGTDAVDWDVNSKQIVGQETCGKDNVKITGTASSGAIKPIPDWHIKVPRTVILDLVTKAGSITIGHSEREINARTGGGDVTIGNVRGETSLFTTAGNIQAGNIWGNADLKSSEAGNLALGDVTGEVSLWTKAGDVTIGSAAKILSAFTGGGNMFFRKVLGSFSGHNDAGSIRIEQAGSWVEASTGSGNIYVKMVPEKQAGDLHISLQAGTGDITLFMPSGMKADIQATGLGSQVKSDVPLVPRGLRGLQGQGLIPALPGGRVAPAIPTITMSSFATTQTGQRNGGGNAIKLHTSLGKIEIKLFN